MISKGYTCVTLLNSSKNCVQSCLDTAQAWLITGSGVIIAPSNCVQCHVEHACQVGDMKGVASTQWTVADAWRERFRHTGVPETVALSCI